MQKELVGRTELSSGSTSFKAYRKKRNNKKEDANARDGDNLETFASFNLVSGARARRGLVTRNPVDFLLLLLLSTETLLTCSRASSSVVFF